MKIDTTNFGVIDIEDDKIITFVENILGFKDYTKFTIINSLENDIYYYLQSIDDPELLFIMLDPMQFIDDYQISLTESFVEKLNLAEENDMLVYTLVSIGEQGAYLSINLKAPIIINLRNQKAGQLVLEEDYPTRYYLAKEEDITE